MRLYNLEIEFDRTNRNRGSDRLFIIHALQTRHVVINTDK